MKRFKFLGLLILPIWLGAAVWAASVEAVPIIKSEFIKPASYGPAAPSGLKTSAFPGTLYVDLDWVDNSANETGFFIERSTEGGPYSQVGMVGSNVTHFNDSNLQEDTLYSYRVRANGVLINSDYSNVAQWTTPPYNPGNLTAVMDDYHPYIYLKWYNPNKHADSIQVRRSTQLTAGNSLTEMINLPGNAQFYVDKSVQPNTSYTYLVMGKNQAGSTKGSNQATVKFMAPPTDLVVYYFPGTTEFSLKWQGNSKNETGFVLETSLDKSPQVEKYDLAPNTVEKVFQMERDHLYMFRVKSLGQDNQHSPYSEVFHWYSPPYIPYSFKATAVSSSEIKLTWEDHSKYESGFRITRKGDNQITPIVVGANTTSYNDTGLKPNTTYTYTIRAYNDLSKTESDVYPDTSATTLPGL